MSFISYSQNLEDVMLWRALKHIERGFYVDIGANDPKVLSITHAFYQHGWHGINVDPVTFELLSRERERDINLEVAVGAFEGKVVFYETSNSVLSTSDPKLAEIYRQSGQLVSEREVPLLTLNLILEKYAKDRDIHFMNIDVEGGELQVLNGLDLSRWRPWIILIEATEPNTTNPTFERWEPLIISYSYEFVYFDGLNRFYVAQEHHDLVKYFRLPPNINDQYILSQQFEGQLQLLEKENKIQELSKALMEREEIYTSYRGSFFYRLYIISSNLRRVHFTPKLGFLNQYQPRQISIPNHYKNEIRLPGKDLPVISIVTPSYNQKVFLERTILSVINQDYPKLEYVIQDGGSTDDSNAIIEKYQTKLTYSESIKDRGQANAINLGFGHTSGEIMAYLNSDDMLLPGTLHFVARYFASHPNVDVVYGHRIIVDENDQEVGIWVMPPHNEKILEWADYVPQETMFWRRRIWEKSGGKLDESFQFALDWDLLIRFQMAGAKIIRLPRFLAMFRVHDSQKSTLLIHERGVEEMSIIRERIHQRKVSLEEVHKRIRKYLVCSVFYHKLYRLGVLRY